MSSSLAKSKKDGLYLKHPCFTDSKFAQIHNKGVEDLNITHNYVGLDYIREGVRKTIEDMSASERNAAAAAAEEKSGGGHKSVANEELPAAIEMKEREEKEKEKEKKKTKKTKKRTASVKRNASVVDN